MRTGGETLVAVYCTLKKARGSKEKFVAYRTGRNNKLRKHYTLLQKESGLSLATLKVNIPLLMKQGLLTFESNGDVVFEGNKTIKKKYGYKLIPIAISKKLTDTKVYVKYVLFHSAMRKQQLRHTRKREQRELLNKVLSLQATVTPAELAAFKKMYKKKNDIKPEDVELLNSLVVSNGLLHDTLAKATDKARKATIQAGYRLKKRYKNFGLIETKRRYVALSDKRISRKLFLATREALCEEFGFFVHWRRGWVCKEVSNEVKINQTELDFSPPSISPSFSPIFTSYYKNISVSRFCLSSEKPC